MKKTLLIILVALLTTIGWYQYSLLPIDKSSQVRESIEIESGMTTKGIATLLKKKDLIRSKFAFLTFVKVSRADGTLQAGKFVLRESLSVREVVLILQTGKADEAIITIPEGFTLKDIEADLIAKGFTEEGALVRCANECDFETFGFLPSSTDGLAERGGLLEGYLFPDTYFVVADDFVPKFFLERLLGHFRKKVIDVYGEKIGNSDRSLHETITMASLIEEEAVTDGERSIISGILWKRYDAERSLGVDASVRYITGNATGAISIADLNTNSPYNTRKFKGLPPGPIASPGMKSIRAALEPSETPYWYYLHDSEGVIHYAETNDEHNTNRMRYLR